MDTNVMAGNRRADPDYGQISGLIPKALITEFKVSLARSGVNQSEAMEQAISLWVAQQIAGGSSK
jgi:hypothetical protein